MCTLTIISNQKGKIITMNRDEQRTRHETNQILHKTFAATVYYFPVDQSSGGTWFGFNNHGHVLALLNRYQDTNVIAHKSRGIIIPQLLPLNSIKGISNSIKNLELVEFQPFDLILSSQKSIIQFSWDGKQLTNTNLTDELPYILSSSSVDSGNVLKHRSTLFDAFNQDNSEKTAEILLKGFHLNQDKSDTSSSVYMSRKDTHSKSISQVYLKTKELQYQYYSQKDLQNFDNRNNEPTCQKIHLDLNC